MKNDETTFMVEKAFQTSSAVTGFVVLQSLTFAYGLSNSASFVRSLDSLWLSAPLFVMGLLLILGGITSVRANHGFIKRHLDSEECQKLNKAQERWRVWTILMFGLLPLYLIVLVKCTDVISGSIAVP